MRTPLRWTLFLALLGLMIMSYGCQKASKESGDEAPQAQAEKKEEAAAAEQDRATSGEAAPEPSLAQDPAEELEEMGDIDLAKDAEGKADSSLEPAKTSAVAGKKKGKKDKNDDEDEEKDKKTWKRSELIPNTAQISVGDDEKLPLEGMDVRLEVDGGRARVLLDFYFFNDHQRQLEGSFKLRLPSGASPHFLAFGGMTAVNEQNPNDPQFIEPSQKVAQLQEDAVLEARDSSWNKPKVARMVQREKAAIAYQETVRRRVDPALMEWAGPGIFSARLFPLAPGQMHRVTLSYDMDLTWIDQDAVLNFDMPELSRSRLELAVKEIAGVELAVSPEAQYDSYGKLRVYRYEGLSKSSLELRQKGLSDALLVDSDAAGDFFAADFKPKLPSAEAKTGGYAVFALDTSLSSNPDRFNIWLELTKQVLDNNRDSIKHFNVLYFNVETRWWQRQWVENTPEQVEALLLDANTLELEGASDIGAALSTVAHPDWLQLGGLLWYDVFFMSDGASTWGESDKFRLTAALEGGLAHAFYAYQTGMSGTDSAFLQHLTRESGGALFSVTGESEIAAASTAHRKRPWTLTKVSVKAGETAGEDLLLAGRPTAIYPGQRLRMVGRGKLEGPATVSLELWQDGESITVDTQLNHTINSFMAPRIYGEVAVGQLEEFGSSTIDLSTAYARHFKVTGASASLLMLETEADYERFNIVPKDDAAAVAQQPVAKVIAEVMAQVGELLGDPKVAFFDLIAKLEANPALAFSLPQDTKAALRGLPAEAFAVPVVPLVTKGYRVGDLDKSIASSLASRSFTYDSVVDDANKRYKEYGPQDALKGLSNLIENNPGDSVLARDVAFQAMEWKLDDQAFYLLRRVAASRPYEPQTYHAIAQSLAALGKTDLAMAYYEIALAGSWDLRFGEFKKIATLEYLHLLGDVEQGKLKTQAGLFAAQRAAALRQQSQFKEADLLIVIAWNTDNTDVDLHVIEPTGEECYYGHRETRIGGQLTQDVTQGYGPEMYTLAKAVAGKYEVRAKYFASDANRMSARTKVYATLYEDWGRENERVTRKVVTLAYGKDMHDLLTIKR